MKPGFESLYFSLKKNYAVCELSDILEVSQPSISKNLSKLRDLNFVTTERKEKFIFYNLKTDNPLLKRTVQDNSGKY